MTVYRRNPLLMTVMGANPGRRPARRRRALEMPSGRQCCSSPELVPAGRGVECLNCYRWEGYSESELAENPGRDPLDFRHRPPYGVAIIMEGSGAPKVVGRKYSTLRQAALVARTLRRRGRSVAVYEVASGDPIGDSEWDPTFRRNPSLAASLAGGMAGAFVTHAMSNPGPSFIVIDSQSGRVAYTKRATGVGSAAIEACAKKARQLADRAGHSFLVYLDIRGARVGNVMHVGMVRTMGITEEVWPTKSNPLTSPEMEEMRDRERFYVGRSQKYEQAGNWPDAAHFRGAAQESRHIRERYHAKGTKFEPNPGPRGKRKITMTIQQFASWVKKKRDPAMWRAFLAKFRGYEKWTHGAKSRKVTLEWQNVPGMDGLWITYDGGKQPESTYIMPKGSPRKGAWKHPWDTMPDIKHDAEAGLVLTKLRGKSKITDFYHR